MPSDFFTRLVERTLHPAGTVRPRLDAPFVPSPPEPVESYPAARAEHRRLIRRDDPAARAADRPVPPEREPEAGARPSASATTREASGSPAAETSERRRPAPHGADRASTADVGADDEHREAVAPAEDVDVVAVVRPASGRAAGAGPGHPRTSPPRPDDGDSAPAPRTPRRLLPATARAARLEHRVAPDETEPEPGVVRIDIGRVEVKATPPPAPPPGRVESTLMSLADYLSGRGRSRR